MTEEVREEAHVFCGSVKGEANLREILNADIIIAVKPNTEAGSRQLERVIARICKVLPGSLDYTSAIVEARRDRVVGRSGVTYNDFLKQVASLAEKPVDVVFLVLEDHGQSQEGS